MIYGDNPQKINEREDKLGLKTYSYTPQISAIVQSGNLYVYCISNPNYYRDPSGQIAIVDDLLIVGGVAAVCFFIAATPYLMEWARAMGKSMADMYRMSKRELNRLIEQANASQSAVAAPGAPDPDDDDLVFGSNTKSAQKLANQMKVRGWTKQSVYETVKNPYTTRMSINRATGNPATVYYTKDGAYVIVDNITNEIVQVSNIFDPAWVPDPNIIDPYIP